MKERALESISLNERLFLDDVICRTDVCPAPFFKYSRMLLEDLKPLNRIYRL